MSNSILLTGTTGFLGGHLLRRLVENRNFQHNFSEIIVTTINDTTVHRLDNILDKITLIDLENENWKDKILKLRPKTIIHLATLYGRNQEEDEKIFRTNLVFPMELLQIAIKCETKIFINTDTSLPRNINSYSVSKKGFVDWLKLASNKICIVNLILEHFYGPNDGKFVSNIINGLIDKVDKIDLTKGNQKRDFIHYDDVLNAYELILNKSKKLEKSFNEFHIGTGTNISIKEILLILQEITGNNTTKLNWGAKIERISEVMNSSTDLTELNKIGFNLQYDLQNGLKDVYKKMRG